MDTCSDHTHAYPVQVLVYDTEYIMSIGIWYFDRIWIKNVYKKLPMYKLSWILEQLLQKGERAYLLSVYVHNIINIILKIVFRGTFDLSSGNGTHTYA